MAYVSLPTRKGKFESFEARFFSETAALLNTVRKCSVNEDMELDSFLEVKIPVRLLGGPTTTIEDQFLSAASKLTHRPKEPQALSSVATKR